MKFVVLNQFSNKVKAETVSFAIVSMLLNETKNILRKNI